MPSKKNRNQGKNGFIVFAESIRNQLLGEGHKINSTADLVTLASPRWQALSKEERETYKEEAKFNKDMVRMAPRRSAVLRPDSRDCTGELLSARVDVESILLKKRRKEREEVVSQWPRGKGVTSEVFYLLAFEIMLYVPENEIIIPCEVSAVQYSIRDGISKTFHRFIKPGSLPLGYRYTATARSEKTHKIPVEGMQCEDPYEKILGDLELFLGGGSCLIPPVYCRQSSAQQAELCISWLAERAGCENRIKRVYEVEGLILDLEAALLNHPLPNFVASISNVLDLLSSSVFDYEVNTRCEYHEEQDTKHCSLGEVKRICYCISDFICPKAGVHFTENHLPTVDTAVEPVYIPLNEPPRGPTQPTNINNVRRPAEEKGRGRGRGRGRGTIIVEQSLRRPGEKATPQQRSTNNPSPVSTLQERHSATSFDRGNQQGEKQDVIARGRGLSISGGAKPKTWGGSAPAPPAAFAPNPPTDWITLK